MRKNKRCNQIVDHTVGFFIFLDHKIYLSDVVDDYFAHEECVVPIAVLVCFSPPTIIKVSGSLVTTHQFSLAPCFQENTRVSGLQNTPGGFHQNIVKAETVMFFFTNIKVYCIIFN